MYRGRFVYLYGLLSALAIAAVAASVLAAANAVGAPVTRTREVPAPGLTQKSTVADTNGRFAEPPAQSVPGEQLGLQGGTCDVRYLADGVVLVCHA